VDTASDQALTLSLGEGDLVPVLQRKKAKKKKMKRYHFSQRLARHKGKSGRFRAGTTPNGRRLNADLKKGKVSGMSLVRRNGARAFPRRVVKASKHPRRSSRLPHP